MSGMSAEGWLWSKLAVVAAVTLVGVYASARYAYRQALGQGHKIQWLERARKWTQTYGWVMLWIVVAILIFLGGSYFFVQLAKTLGEARKTEAAPSPSPAQPTVTSTQAPAAIPTVQPMATLVIQDPAGQVLSPVTPTALPPPPTATSAPTAVPTPQVTFEADSTAVAFGECVRLHWNVQPANPTDLKVVRLGVREVPPVAIERICPTETPGPYQLTVGLADGMTETYTTTVAVQPAPTQPPTPTTAYIRSDQPQKTIALFTSPVDGATPVAQLTLGSLAASLHADGQTTDGSWYRICCFTLAGDDAPKKLWVKDDSADNPIVMNRQALAQTQLVVAPTPLPPPLPFSRAIGPEFHDIKNLNLLRILVKVYVGTDALPGYLLTVRFQPKGQTQWQYRANSSATQNGNGDTTSQAQFSNTSEGAYNYKYEFSPDDGILGEGTWQIWLTNAEHEQLSPMETFTTAPNNPNTEVYIGWVRVQ